MVSTQTNLLTTDSIDLHVVDVGKILSDTALTKFQPLNPSYPLTLSLYDIK